MDAAGLSQGLRPTPMPGLAIGPISRGDTLVVGAPISDDTGTVYEFTRTGSVWSQHAALKASNARAGDFFGSSVAISGDTVVVGARFEDSGAQGIDAN